MAEGWEATGADRLNASPPHCYNRPMPPFTPLVQIILALVIVLWTADKQPGFDIPKVIVRLAIVVLCAVWIAGQVRGLVAAG